MTSSEIFVGLGLLLALAVGCQIAATTLRLPAIVLLLPVGFVAGRMTDTVDPTELFGAAFSPMVSLAVAVILFEGGLDLNVKELEGHSQRVVRRLILWGVPITWAGAGLLAWLLLDLSSSGGGDARRNPHRVRPHRRCAAAGAGPPGPSIDDDPRMGEHDHRPDRRDHRSAGVPGSQRPGAASDRAESCSSSQATSRSAYSAGLWAPSCSGSCWRGSSCSACSPRRRPSPPWSPSPPHVTRYATTPD